MLHERTPTSPRERNQLKEEKEMKNVRRRAEGTPRLIEGRLKDYDGLRCLTPKKGGICVIKGGMTIYCVKESSAG